MSGDEVDMWEPDQQLVPDEALLSVYEQVGILDKYQHEVGKEDIANMTATEIVELFNRGIALATEKATRYWRGEIAEMQREWHDSMTEVVDLQRQLDAANDTLTIAEKAGGIFANAAKEYMEERDAALAKVRALERAGWLLHRDVSTEYSDMADSCQAWLIAVKEPTSAE